MGANHRQQFGKYTVLGLLGQGGMARVYLALAAGPAGVTKLLVVKELKSELALEAEAREMFLDEARLSTRLSHPNVVQTYEVAEEGETMYLTMEYLEGQPLQAILSARTRGLAVPTGLLLRAVAETPAGLHYAHELRDYDGSPLAVVHRDVSPHNVFVTYDGTVKLVDFGVAKAADASTQTASGLFKGKVRYSAPEQATAGVVDHRADVFAVGVLLWEVLAGRRMWRQEADATVLLRLAQGELPRLREANPDVPVALEAIVERALQVDPERRYATAEEMRAELTAYLEGQSQPGPDLGRWMREAFAAERAAARTMIEGQMRALREEASRSHPRMPLGSLPELVKSPSVVTELASERTAAPLGAGRSGMLRAGAALAAIAVLGTVVFVRRQGQAEAASEPVFATPAKAPVQAPPPPAPSPTKVSLSLHVMPRDAKLFLDGAPLAGNPFEGDAERDESSHVVTARAEGYQSRSFTVTFDRDVQVHAELPPAPRATEASPPRARSGSAPAAAHPPSGRTAPRRTIDEDDPYHP